MLKCVIYLFFLVQEKEEKQLSAGYDVFDRTWSGSDQIQSKEKCRKQ
jgi:hypothetical protein